MPQTKISPRITVNPTPVIVVNPNPRNSMGTAGLILSIIGLVTGWVPILSWIVMTLGVIFSIIGVFKSPRGYAIAGIIISILSCLFYFICWKILLT